MVKNYTIAYEFCFCPICKEYKWQRVLRNILGEWRYHEEPASEGQFRFKVMK